MELNNDRTNLAKNRYPEVLRASESRNAEIKATVDRVRDVVAAQQEVTTRISGGADSIELSDAASRLIDGAEPDRSERVAELRAAVEDGSLFNRDRLALAAERLLTSE